MRNRLLDLSSRNRLLNFKHTKGKSLQFVDVRNLDALFERFLEGRDVILAPVLEPEGVLFSSTAAKTDAPDQAQLLGIPISR